MVSGWLRHKEASAEALIRIGTDDHVTQYATIVCLPLDHTHSKKGAKDDVQG